MNRKHLVSLITLAIVAGCIVAYFIVPRLMNDSRHIDTERGFMASIPETWNFIPMERAGSTIHYISVLSPSYSKSCVPEFVSGHTCGPDDMGPYVVRGTIIDVITATSAEDMLSLKKQSGGCTGACISTDIKLGSIPASLQKREDILLKDSEDGTIYAFTDRIAIKISYSTQTSDKSFVDEFIRSFDLTDK